MNNETKLRQQILEANRSNCNMILAAAIDKLEARLDRMEKPKTELPVAPDGWTYWPAMPKLRSVNCDYEYRTKPAYVEIWMDSHWGMSMWYPSPDSLLADGRVPSATPLYAAAGLTIDAMAKEAAEKTHTYAADKTVVATYSASVARRAVDELVLRADSDDTIGYLALKRIHELAEELTGGKDAL